MEVITSMPVFNRNCKRRFWKGGKVEADSALRYTYASVFNAGFVRQAFLFFGTLYHTVRWLRKTPAAGRVVLCEALSLFQSLGAVAAARLFRCPCVGVVTDIPRLMMDYAGGRKKGLPDRLLAWLYSTLCTGLISKYDGYVLITEEMSRMVNPDGRPFVVIEGICDGKRAASFAPGTGRTPRVVLYAGALHARFGALKLVEAFRKVHGSDAELWLYGNGDAVSEIGKHARQDPRIRCLGVVPNEQVVEAERQAVLLVNPRSSREEYTRYSFPSKTLEYMATGTPVLMAPLPGMPPEYKPHLYLLEDESVEGMAESISALLSTPPEILRKKGKEAQDFVLKEKSAFRRAGELLAFVKSLPPSLKKGGRVPTTQTR